MEEIRMNMELLNIICAVLNYKKFICSQNMLGQFHTDNFDWYNETEKYFNTLSLPEGMKHNLITFEMILSYGVDGKRLDRLRSMECCDLEKEYFCGDN